MRRAGILLLGVVVVLSWSGGDSWGEEKTYRMATEEWPPFRLIDPGSQSGFRGIDIELVAALERVLGVRILIERHPWARALEMMRAGQVDFLTGVARTAEREQFMHYVDVSYCAVRPRFYTQKGKGKEILSYEHLYGKTIGYSLNSAYFEPFNSDSKLVKQGLSTETQLLQVLALNRLDIIIGTDPNLSYDVARLKLGEEVELTAYQPDKRTDLYIAISKRSPMLEDAATVEGALRTLLAEGVVERILQDFGGPLQ
jgi:polar amino acid transport system substrate-binding protein